MTASALYQRLYGTLDVKPVWCADIVSALGERRYAARDTDGSFWLCQIQMVRREFFDSGPIGVGQRPWSSVLMPVFGPVTAPLVVGPYAPVLDPLFARHPHDL